MHGGSAGEKPSEERGKPFLFSSPTAESFGVSAQIGSGVVRGGPEVRFHQGSTSVPRGFHEVLRGLRRGASTKKSTACCWGCHLSFFFFGKVKAILMGLHECKVHGPSLPLSCLQSSIGHPVLRYSFEPELGFRLPGL